MYQTGKTYWEVGTIVKRIGRMIYLVKGPKMVHKRHLKKKKSIQMNWTILQLMLSLWKFFSIDLMCPFLGKLLRQKNKVRRQEGIQGESPLTRKGKDIDSVNLKKVGALYTLLVTSNRYIPFLINTLDTIVRVGDLCWQSSQH